MEGKVIVITGASRGIGKEMGITFSRLGAKVVLAARGVKDIEKFKDELSDEWMIHYVDISDEDSTRCLMEAVIKKYGRIDVLINNAGFVEPTALLETTLSQWEKTVTINLTGCFLCTKEAVRFMKKNGGKIVNIGSTAGLSARPGWSAYAASKAAVVNFSLTMAEELRIYGIKVFCICPGRTATDLRQGC